MTIYDLNQYNDICVLVVETEEDIRKLKKRSRKTVQDKVQGSMQEYPYARTSIKIEGDVVDHKADAELKKRQQQLFDIKQQAEEKKKEIEDFMATAPARIVRIIRYKYLEHRSWENAAIKMGGKATGDSIRMELKRYFSEKK